MIDLQQIQCSCANIIHRTTYDINNVGNQIWDKILLLEIESNDEVRQYRKKNKKIKFRNINKCKNDTTSCESSVINQKQKRYRKFW